MKQNWIWLAVFLVSAAFNPFMREVPEVKSANEKLKARDYPGAEEAYKKALESRASNARLRHNLGLALLAQNNYAAAESEFVAATASDSAIVRSRGNFFLGIVRFHLAETLQEPEPKIAKYKEAADNFRRVLEADPDDEEARWNLEMALERIEDVEREKDEKQKQQEQQEKQQEKQQNPDQNQQNQQNQNQQQNPDQNQQNPPAQPDSPEVRAARRALQDLKERQKQRILEMHRKGGQGRRAPIKDW